jgi:hypothetical protein
MVSQLRIFAAKVDTSVLASTSECRHFHSEWISLTMLTAARSLLEGIEVAPYRKVET